MYPAISHKHGIPSLARTLHKILLARIETCLPQLRQRIKTSITHYERVLSSYGEPLEDPKKFLLELLTKYSTAYCNKIIGTHSELETRELTGGARISYIFLETYGRALAGVNPLEGLNRASIITAIRNTNGVRPPFFVPETCFELLVKKQIERLESPSLTCVQLIHDELERIITDVGPQLTVTLSRFPTLMRKIKTIASDLIKNRVHITNEMVTNLVRIHCSYINTSHPDFVRDKIDVLANLRNSDRGDEPSLPMIHSADASSEPCDADPRRECVLVERLITSYFNVVKRSIQDSVPKAIMHFLVNHVMDRLPSDLVSQLYGKEATRILFEESLSVSEQRKQVKALLKSYRKADSVIDELKEAYYQQ